MNTRHIHLDFANHSFSNVRRGRLPDSLVGLLIQELMRRRCIRPRHFLLLGRSRKAAIRRLGYPRCMANLPHDAVQGASIPGSKRSYPSRSISRVKRRSLTLMPER